MLVQPIKSDDSLVAYITMKNKNNVKKNNHIFLHVTNGKMITYCSLTEDVYLLHQIKTTIDAVFCIFWADFVHKSFYALTVRVCN